jgi:hypothetical protein
MSFRWFAWHWGFALILLTRRFYGRDDRGAYNASTGIEGSLQLRGPDVNSPYKLAGWMKCDSTQAASAISPDATARPAPNAADRAFYGSQRGGNRPRLRPGPRRWAERE